MKRRDILIAGLAASALAGAHAYAAKPSLEVWKSPECGCCKGWIIQLAVPAMPLGSPGMDGPDFDNQTQPYDVLLVLKDGSTRVYQSYR